MHNIDSQTIQLVIIAVAALAVVFQAIFLVAILISVKKATVLMHVEIKKASVSMHAEIQDLRSSIVPVIENSRDFLTRVAPRIESVSEDVAEITQVLRSRINATEAVVADILERTHRQSARVDSMLTGVLDSVERAGEFVSQHVGKPARQISAILASAKAIVQTLGAPAPRVQRPIQRSLGPGAEKKPV
ncbi:MAG: hypothetical protein ABSD67_11745 [Terracidiphilus sp.]|jgi:ABC-type transporter Mla subunit MlaD